MIRFFIQKELCQGVCNDRWHINRKTCTPACSQLLNCFGELGRAIGIFDRNHIEIYCRFSAFGGCEYPKLYALKKKHFILSVVTIYFCTFVHSNNHNLIVKK